MHGQADGETEGAEDGNKGVGGNAEFIDGRKDDERQKSVIDDLADKGIHRMVIVGMTHHLADEFFAKFGDITAYDKNNNRIDHIGAVGEEKMGNLFKRQQSGGNLPTYMRSNGGCRIRVYSHRKFPFLFRYVYCTPDERFCTGTGG
ncbi:hypothetical protein HMPREF3033_00996 [Veillonellaceae bacterium DNF00751]|nr:hypothetical protein HMPREF3033_00996 [Veillonellaceae bacterium DNF00751]